ncbi:bifunctional allantoicase/(S)-ureidoglycine aminohydrolase [Microbacterium sp. MPKO10]|uniref:bifunctional allantoicase/(S)-ureidoglycine aminohydrolase n=1 Tax=Microbacterium sp. MPKO10 TaxID=2989818 RepID=UPI0022366685|nr:bifunctional allantoicase/(S)-ureidoglycine aminohydrolase [Microbacterium sp. MPKO10]MCW4458602.1 bifunctional allantoicase/(S)-ureidoglycine aminohydrolase [Microbacterium sp. MPKO10]
MSDRTYYAPEGGLPPQTDLLTDRAIVTEAYQVTPRGVLRDIVTSNLPEWQNTRAWVLAKPIAGFSTTFAQLIVEVGAGGGSDRPEPEAGVESVVFVLRGSLVATIDGTEHTLDAGGYAYLPAGCSWTLHNRSGDVASFQWVRKEYEPLAGVAAPAAFVTSDDAVEPTPMPDTDGAWATTRFVDPADMAHDMHVNIVTFEPGGSIPFAETHIMEHGLYVLEGKAVYRLNGDWVEVQEGDFMWLRAFCPQACYAGGPSKFRYLLYKDVNRQVSLTGSILKS